LTLTTSGMRRSRPCRPGHLWIVLPSHVPCCFLPPQARVPPLSRREFRSAVSVSFNRSSVRATSGKSQPPLPSKKRESACFFGLPGVACSHFLTCPVLAESFPPNSDYFFAPFQSMLDLNFLLDGDPTSATIQVVSLFPPSPQVLFFFSFFVPTSSFRRVFQPGCLRHDFRSRSVGEEGWFFLVLSK